MMFRQITRLMFGLVLVFGLIGCDGSGGGSGDTTAPVITLNGKSSVTIKKGTKYADAGATAKDKEDGTVKVTTSGSVDSSKIGTYTITYTAKDKAGNEATKKRVVKVVKHSPDTTPPVITLKGNSTVTIEKGTKYTDAGATAKDNIDGNVKVISSGSVNSSKLGTYTITYTATDKAGNKATATRKVKVVLPPDTVAPVITIIGDNPFEITQGETFSDPGATATDDRDGTVTVTPSGKVDMDSEGSYTITYTATVKAGNKATATRTVIVKPADAVWNVSSITEFRKALEDAAANGENDRIVLAKGTYNVTSDGLGTLEFDDNEAFNLTIEAEEGLTFKDVILDGNNSTQVFNFNNKANSTLILKNISVIDGNTTKNGAVYTNQSIEVKDCNISNNIASSGGGFYSSGTTKVTNSIISNNNSREYGGGFYSTSTTIVDTSTIANNVSIRDDGGFSSSGQTTVKKSIISNNNSGRYNGGFGSYSTTIVSNSNIFDNKSNGSTGGFGSGGATTVINSSITNMCLKQ